MTRRLKSSPFPLGKGASERQRRGLGRLALLLAIIASAVLLPAIPLGRGLPDLRVEQILALPALAWVLLDWRRSGAVPRPALLDWIFLALALSTLASVLWAPLVLGTGFSPRDLFEVLKVALYWTLFRFGLQSAAGAAQGSLSPQSSVLSTLLMTGAVAGAFGVAQYYNWLGVNDWATGAWAPAHHLRTLAESARAVGTVGNANYFGMLSVTVLLAAVASLAVAPGRMARWVATAGLAGGALGLVTSASRGATLAWIAGMLALWATVAVLRPRGLRAIGIATAAAAVVLVAAVALVEAAPRGRTTYLTRMIGSAAADADGSVALRVERWRSALAPWLDRRRATAVEPPLVLTSQTTVRTTGVASAGPGPAERDRQRKADLHRIVAALDRYRTDGHALPPDGEALAAALVPAYLDALPQDPTGGAYRYERTAAGFSLGARLEDPADADFPIYGVGRALNYLHNGDLEAGNGAASAFRTLPGTEYELTSDDALFGERSARFRGNPAMPERRAALFQQRYVGRPGGAPFTAELWVKLLGPIDGDLALYTNIYYEDGSRSDPHARVSADPARIGVWQRLTARIEPETGRRVRYMGVYLVGDGFRGEALVDGFALVDGGLPLSFPLLREAPTAVAGYDAEGRLRDSPLFGVGPQKAEQAGTTDNEYLLVVARYGVVGLTLYLALWGGVLVAMWRGLRGSEGGPAAALRLTVGATVVAFLVFNLVAGSLLHLQLMGLFWTLVGVAVANDGVTDARPRILRDRTA